MERFLLRLKLIRPLVFPLVLYMVSLMMVLIGLDWLGNSYWRFALALLPLLPGVFIAAGVVKTLRNLDELEQKIIQDSLGIAFMLTLLLCLSLGFLEQAGMAPVNPLYIALFMALALLAGKLILNRKYR